MLPKLTPKKVAIQKGISEDFSMMVLMSMQENQLSAWLCLAARMGIFRILFEQTDNFTESRYSDGGFALFQLTPRTCTNIKVGLGQSRNVQNQLDSKVL
jgi:hypothetical protein